VETEEAEDEEEEEKEEEVSVVERPSLRSKTHEEEGQR
jgi:hypothetical protein